MKIRRLLFAPMLLLCMGAVAQLPRTLVITSGEPACTSSFIIDSLGCFFRVSNCKGHSTVSIGHYQLQKDTINFTFESFDNFPPILRMEQTPATSDTTVTVWVKTRFNSQLPPDFIIDAIDTSGKSYTRLTADQYGAVRVNPSRVTSLRFNELNKFYSKFAYAPVTKQNMTVYINFPSRFFYYDHPTILIGQDFSLLLRNNKLYDLSGNEYDPQTDLTALFSSPPKKGMRKPHAD